MHIEFIIYICIRVCVLLYKHNVCIVFYLISKILTEILKGSNSVIRNLKGSKGGFNKDIKSLSHDFTTW